MGEFESCRSSQSFPSIDAVAPLSRQKAKFGVLFAGDTKSPYCRFRETAEKIAENLWRRREIFPNF
jgi:hypothetical protein